ncbi:MAG: ferrochelatase [Gemmataceae bacterium]|nr:ferrochelatase [Gemmataceae bacterium]
MAGGRAGVLLIQLGTPDEPTTPALRRYLKQFLSDPRVIDSKLFRKVILPLIVLPTRPAKSAEKYRRIWDPATGSPLMHYTRRQTALLAAQLPGVVVRFGMQVGNPPIADVVNEMIAAGVDRIVALPMYPQYSDTTTASATDVLFAALQKIRRVPAVRIVPPYADHPAYLDALVAVVRDELKRIDWTPDHFVISFHGIPRRYAVEGDPYATDVVRTTRGLVRRMGWPRSLWTQTYQSLFGREVWLKPYTDDTLARLAKAGKRNVFVITPGFTADCLETIDEIGHESAELFHEAGGGKLHQCRCLNDHPAWIAALRQLAVENGAGWPGF